MIIIDTGPLVAALSEGDTHHSWADHQFKSLSFPFITCEAVITESIFFLQEHSKNVHNLSKLLTSGAIKIAFELDQNLDAIFDLIQKYENRNRPMDLADACLVRMAEMYPKSQILTIDSDFTVYRKNRNQPIDVVMPG